ncbi:DNA excision repair protein ERCC-5 [Latimeria chalumnae]|uniref:DNA excision repair protein ERCC-5 n=1 Tax=Latimeria chalumnae TaxID=7897 RepID=UPI0006D92707|nr:PREDICTED: DNA repair protein complementing XP-G cells isoform X1 [Latimeria chalumnae]|eukprot:XP_014342998.1 PREDICTED: DNA repair protein complementing XP-G cells isoform X1 [Latimeria chalumnae]
MGVQGLWKLLECTGRPINPETLEGKILAVDISIWLNQAVKGVRDGHGNSIQNAHLLTLFHRLCKLLFFRIRPIFVFDGDAPLLKKQTLATRRQRKELAVSDSKKTTEKLLKTFLKRQALKAALGQRSSEPFPSLSEVRRQEIDDIYVLPPLEEKEEKSSDEEEEQIWRDRMNNKQLFQEEFFQDPHSVDIDSQDFSSLPPELKHEILTDMKNFTKRRRTLFEAMPEESRDFSQYQLTGLLKRNKLNQCIENVQKEMNDQHVGQLQEQYASEGGFIRDMETRKVVSDDSSHYILIKGIQSKKVKEESGSCSAATSLKASVDDSKTIEKSFTNANLPSPQTLKAIQTAVSEGEEEEDISATGAPPSPRTLIAMEAAMIESSSEEDLEIVCEKPVIKLDRPQLSTNVVEGNVSPRTLLAIQQSLIDQHETGLLLHDREDKQMAFSNNKAVILTSSDGDSDDDEEGIKLANSDKEPCRTNIPISSIQGSPKVCPIVVDLEIKSSSIETESSGSSKPPSSVFSDDIPASSTGKEKTIGKQQSTEARSIVVSGVSDNPSQDGTVCKPGSSNNDCVSVAGELAEKSSSTTIKPDVSAKSKESMSENMEFVPQREAEVKLKIKSSIPITEEKTGFANKTIEEVKEESNSDEDSFVEVVVDINKADADSSLFPPETFSTSQPESENQFSPEGMEPYIQSCIQEEGNEAAFVWKAGAGEAEMVLCEKAGVGKENEAEAAINEWEDINPNELEALESNLFVQQSSLQAQRQQQERIAATVTGQMYLESQELLCLFGIPYIVAPMEAEAQCAVLDLTDQTSGTLTDDSDIWLFGARHVYKNFFSHNKDVKYYQYVDIHNQLGLDRRKLINLAYLMGSDYTEGIPGVGYVTAMEILNEFPGPGMEPLHKFVNWWTETQKNKKMRPNPNDTKVKKKLWELQLYPGFPNPAVAEAYLKPTVDDSKGAFSWGQPDLEQIREFCGSRFGWSRTKLDEVLLPVMKQLNTQQTQLRIDSFFRLEQHERQAIKSQRLRRAVTCMQRKEKEGEASEVLGAIAALEEDLAAPVGGKRKKPAKGTEPKSTGCHAPHRKRKQPLKSWQETQTGGFIGNISLSEPSSGSGEESESEGSGTAKVQSNSQDFGSRKKVEKDRNGKRSEKDDRTSSSSSDEDEKGGKGMLVTAKSVFENKRGKSNARGKRRKKN